MELDINNLRNLFLRGWSQDTSYPKTKENWSPENPTFGQCAVTALVINDLFKGQIVNNTQYHHYWNILEDGTHIDLTKEQWGDIVIEGYEPTTREYILFSERGREVKTLERYQLLRRKIEKEILHVDYIPETLEESFEYVDKFLQDEEVFKNEPEKNVMGIAHMTLGRYLRNKWCLWWDESFAIESIKKKDSNYPQEKPKLKLYFESLGVNHPDDMSGIIIISYHRKLNNKKLKLNKQVTDIIEFYKQD